MIYRFIIVSDEEADFMREIQLPADATFYDFHRLILDSCGYSDGELTSFTICENGWERVQDINLEEIETSADQDSYLMKETRLNEFLTDEKQHLLYTFDPLGGRVFFIELAEIITGKKLAAGKVTRSQGNAPVQQLDFDELLARHPIVTDDDSLMDDDDLYGDQSFNDDDLDMEGFNISDGNPFE